MPYLPKAKNIDIIVQELKTETLLYDLQRHQAFCLNQTLALIWRACDGHTTFDELKKRSGGKLTDDLIILGLARLQKEDLLQEWFETELSQGRISRREMLAKYGSLTVSLPLITTLVAPTAVSAQSVSTCFESGFLLADQVTDCNNCSISNFDNVIQFCCSNTLAVPVVVNCNPEPGFPGSFRCTSPCA